MTGASILHARPSIKQGRSTMTTRREFIFAAAAGAAMLTRISSALAATYDLVIKGGRVIDPAARINAMRDVAIVGGRIAAIESNIAAMRPPTIATSRIALILAAGSMTRPPLMTKS